MAFGKFLSVVLASAIGSAAFSIAASGAEPIKVGVTIPLSPPGSVEMGHEARTGLEIMKDYINQNGGVNGRQITLVYEDDQGIPEKGRAATEKLITQDKVVAVTGPLQSSVCLAAIEVAHRYGTPYVNTNCWSDAVRKKGYPEVFSVGNYNSRVSAAVAETIGKMNVKRVVAFAENTDYGIGLANLIADLMKKNHPSVQFTFHILDRAGKDFMPAVLPLKSNPPDVVVNLMLPPASYVIGNQLFEQGIAPGPKTWMYDTGNADFPDFWQNAKEAGQYIMSFGLYHPQMEMPKLGKQVAEEYTKRMKKEPNRLTFQAADSLLLIAEAIRIGGSDDAKTMVNTMKTMTFNGVRGSFQFSQEPGPYFQSWKDIPYVNIQFTEMNQPMSKATLLEGPGVPLALDKLKPAPAR